MHPLANNGEQAEDEETVHKVRHCVAEEVHGGDVVGARDGPGEELLRANSDG